MSSIDAASSAQAEQRVHPDTTHPCVHHGLEDVEEMALNHLTECGEDWVASRQQLTQLFMRIATHDGALPKPNTARIHYNYDARTQIMHIFLSIADGDPEPTPYEARLKSVFLDLTDVQRPRILANQYEQILYNDVAQRWYQDQGITWDQVEVQDSIDGTHILQFQHNGITINATSRCMNAADSNWNRQQSHMQLFSEVTENRITDVDPNIILSFALVHPRNENIIAVSNLSTLDDAQRQHGTAIVIDAREKWTMRRVPFDATAMPNIDLPRATIHDFTSFEQMQNALAARNAQITASGRLDSEGFIVRVYRDATKTVLWKLLKFQTTVFQDMKRMRPNTGQIAELVIGLYVSKNLAAYTQWYPLAIDKQLIHDIKHGFPILANELHYAVTRTLHHNNAGLYESLTTGWRQCIYDIRGVHFRKIKQQKRADASQRSGFVRITLNDVTEYLRSLPIRKLVCVIADRTQIIANLYSARDQGTVQTVAPFEYKSVLDSLTAYLMSVNKRYSEPQSTRAVEEQQ